MNNYISSYIDIDRNLGPAKGILVCHLDKEQLRHLFLELGLAHKTLQDNLDHYGLSQYTEDLVRAWISGRDDVLKKPEYPGGATWKNLRKALTKEGHGEAAREIYNIIRRSKERRRLRHSTAMPIRVAAAGTT